MNALRERDKETICAVITPPGTGGVSIIRVSGKEALRRTLPLSPFLNHKKIESHKCYFGNFQSPQGEPIDEVLVTYFQEGHSFTGEETLEIALHGNPFLAQRILDCLLEAGIKHAERGEFSYRAFMNGRIDLVQAESILSLIESQTAFGSRMAFRQLKGELSRVYESIENNLIWVAAHLEANIDYAQEDIVVAEVDLLINKLNECLDDISELLKTQEAGRLLKTGLQVCIVGKPNSGKSSLLNDLVSEEKSIVTDVAGTTRDLIEASVIIEGIKINFVDTAGLRETEDLVEKIGIQRARRALEESDLIIYVIDTPRFLSSSLYREEEEKQISEFSQEKLRILFNKMDLVDKAVLSSPPSSNIIVEDKSIEINELSQAFKFQDIIKNILDGGISSFEASCKTGDGLDSLKKNLVEYAKSYLPEDSVSILSRHKQLLISVESNIKSAIELLSKEESPEFIMLDLKSAVVSMKAILGKVYDDEIMDRVFSEFCLGK